MEVHSNTFGHTFNDAMIIIIEPMETANAPQIDSERATWFFVSSLWPRMDSRLTSDAPQMGIVRFWSEVFQ